MMIKIKMKTVMKIKMKKIMKVANMMTRILNKNNNLKSIKKAQDYLISIVRAKLSERVESHASQVIATKLLFEQFDTNNDHVLDESEFRECLEKLNIQFDDIQCLALFAYFDLKNEGWINYEEFASAIMVKNPRDGTACLPKMIVSSRDYL